jgi:hypothetical protein
MMMIIIAAAKVTFSVLQRSLERQIRPHSTFVVNTLPSSFNFEIMGVFQRNTQE